MDRAEVEVLTDKFIRLLNQGYEYLVQAGEIAVKLAAIWPEWPEYVCARSNLLTRQRIHELQAVGRREIHPETLMSPRPAVQRLKRCPYRVQEQALQGPVELVIDLGQGVGVDVIRTDVRNLTPRQARSFIPMASGRPQSSAWLVEELHKARTQRDGKARITSQPYRLSEISW